MGTIEAVELPTEAEYAGAVRALDAAHDVVETLVLRLWPLALGDEREHLYPDRPTTREDVALLWSFRSGLKMRLREHRNYVDMLGQSLGCLETARVERYVAGETA